MLENARTKMKSIPLFFFYVLYSWANITNATGNSSSNFLNKVPKKFLYPLLVSNKRKHDIETVYLIVHWILIVVIE